MAGHAVKPLLSLEELIRPVEPPPLGLDRPVCPGVHARVLHKLQSLEHALVFLRKGIEALPRHQVYVEGLQRLFAESFDEAGQAYALFRETLDCEGEA